MPPDIEPRPSALTPPLALLRAALKWARMEGIPVAAQSDAGIICVSSEAAVRWRKDPMFSHVSPSGALVLMQQPRSTHTWSAVAEVLGGSLPFSEGVQDGAARLPPREAVFGNAQRLYVEGWEVGSIVRRMVVSHAENG